MGTLMTLVALLVGYAVFPAEAVTYWVTVLSG